MACHWHIHVWLFISPSLSPGSPFYCSGALQYRCEWVMIIERSASGHSPPWGTRICLMSKEHATFYVEWYAFICCFALIGHNNSESMDSWILFYLVNLHPLGVVIFLSPVLKCHDYFFANIVHIQYASQSFSIACRRSISSRGYACQHNTINCHCTVHQCLVMCCSISTWCTPKFH